MDELKIFLARPLFRVCVVRLVGASVLLAFRLRLIGDRRGWAIMRPFIEWQARGYRVTFPAQRRKWALLREIRDALVWMLLGALSGAVVGVLIGLARLFWAYWGAL